MSIDFSCVQCGSTLRTPAGTAGKQAKCPQCGAVMAIPPEAGAPLDPPPREPEFRPESFPPRQETGNPFQSPAAALMEETVYAARGFRPSRIDFSTVFDRAWQLYKRNFGLLAGCGLLIAVLMILLDSLVQRLFNVQPQQFMVGFEFRPDDAARTVRQSLAGLVTVGISAYFFIGMILVTLKMARGERATVNDLFSGGPFLLNGIIVHWIVSLLTMIGLSLCLVPGIYVLLVLGLSMYMVVDQRTGIADSLRYSYLAMQGNLLAGLGLLITAIGLLTAATIFTCMLGLPLVWPLAIMMMSVAYLMATGQLPVERGY
jgi:hypothetical protein